MAENTVTKKVEANGDQVTWTVEIEHVGGKPSYGTAFSIEIPAGISLVGPEIDGASDISVSKGAWDPSNEKWVIGTIGAGEIVITDFIFQVDDLTLVDPVSNWFQIEGTIDSSCIDGETIYLIISEYDECVGGELEAGSVNDDCCEDPDLSVN